MGYSEREDRSSAYSLVQHNRRDGFSHGNYSSSNGIDGSISIPVSDRDRDVKNVSDADRFLNYRESWNK